MLPNHSSLAIITNINAKRLEKNPNELINKIAIFPKNCSFFIDTSGTINNNSK